MINFIESCPLDNDSSNNNGVWGTREEIDLAVRRMEGNIREEIQGWREEMERENRELKNEIMRIQRDVVLQKELLRRENMKMCFFLIFFYI